MFLRLLRDEKGKALFTFQELSVLSDSNHPRVRGDQASSQHMEDFRDCDGDFLNFLTRKRKVDIQVVEAVTCELLHDPLARYNELQQRVNARLSRDDLTTANIKAAMEQIPYLHVRESVNKQIDKGKVHYQEEYLLEEMMRSMSPDAGHYGRYRGSRT